MLFFAQQCELQAGDVCCAYYRSAFSCCKRVGSTSTFCNMKICSVGRWYYAQQTIQTCNAALLRDKSKPQCYPFYLAFTWNNCDIVMLGTLRCSRTSSYSPYLQIGHIRILAVGLELPCNGGSCGGISLKIDECNLHLKRLPCISLTCKLVPVQYRQYEYGLLKHVSVNARATTGLEVRQ